MRCEDGRVAVSELVEQPRRSLDVREKEGDQAAWQLAHGLAQFAFRCGGSTAAGAAARAVEKCRRSNRAFLLRRCAGPQKARVLIVLCPSPDSKRLPCGRVLRKLVWLEIRKPGSRRKPVRVARLTFMAAAAFAALALAPAAGASNLRSPGPRSRSPARPLPRADRRRPGAEDGSRGSSVPAEARAHGRRPGRTANMSSPGLARATPLRHPDPPARHARL